MTYMLDDNFFFALVMNAPINISVVREDGSWLWSFNDSPRLLDPETLDISTADRERLQLVIKSVAYGKQDSVSVRADIRGNDGIWRPNLIIVKNMRQEPTVKAIGLYFYDVSELEEAEKAVALLDVTMKTLVDAIDDPIMVHDNSHVVLYLNQAFLDMFKVLQPLESFIDKSLTYLYPVAGTRFAQDEVANIDGYTLIANGEPVLGKEWVLTDGKVVTRDYIPIKIKSTVKAHLWIYRDITPKGGNLTGQ